MYRRKDKTVRVWDRKEKPKKTTKNPSRKTNRNRNLKADGEPLEP